jgi:hypothetical protein
VASVPTFPEYEYKITGVITDPGSLGATVVDALAAATVRSYSSADRTTTKVISLPGRRSNAVVETS